MASLKLAIVTPSEDILATDADEVVVPGSGGEIGFLDGHIHMITALKPGVLAVHANRKKTFYAISSGFAEIEDNVLNVLTNACEEASTIDVARARHALEAAQNELAKLGPDDKDYHRNWRRIERAQARLAAAARLRN